MRQAGVRLGALDEVRVAQSIALLEALGLIEAGMTAGEIMDLDLVITTD